jgi:FkbM family methyltransferase
MNSADLLSSIGRLPVIGTAARWYAGCFDEGSIVRIRHGHLAGCLWRRRHRYVHGYWIGHYEWPLQETLRRELHTGDTVFDLGAHAGFFTLLAARLVGPTGRCIAFEPLPANCDSIREQLGLNGVHHARVVTKAISSEAGLAALEPAWHGASMGRLPFAPGGAGQTPVKLTTIDLAAERYGRPHFIKMDIEGAEARALDGASETLRTARPTFLIELHDADSGRLVKDRLDAADYQFHHLAGQSIAADGALPTHFVATPRERAP